MKHTLTFALTGIALAIASSGVAQNLPKIPKNAHMLFVQLGERATIQKKGTHYVLHMNGIHRHTLWFTDRPYHLAGTVDTGAFVTQWDKRKRFDFNRMNPNAEFVAYTHPQQADQYDQHHMREKTMTFELSHPTYDASQHKINYQAKLLYPQNASLHTKESLYDYSLFIDSSCSVWNFWDC